MNRARREGLCQDLREFLGEDESVMSCGIRNNLSIKSKDNEKDVIERRTNMCKNRESIVYFCGIMREGEKMS